MKDGNKESAREKGESLRRWLLRLASKVVGTEDLRVLRQFPSTADSQFGPHATQPAERFAPSIRPAVQLSASICLNRETPVVNKDARSETVHP